MRLLEAWLHLRGDSVHVSYLSFSSSPAQGDFSMRLFLAETLVRPLKTYVPWGLCASRCLFRSGEPIILTAGSMISPLQSLFFLLIC